MLIARYTDRLEMDNGQIIRIVTGHPINKMYADIAYDFYKVADDGTAQCRNLYTSSYNGYRISFPGIPLGRAYSYYGTGTAVEEDWGNCRVITCFSSGVMTDEDQELVAELYPDFIYVMRKWKSTRAVTLKALNIWLEHPEIELLLAAGFEHIALNRSFWRYSENTRKKVCLWLRKHPGSTKSLKTIMLALKNNLTDQELSDYEKWDEKHYGQSVSYELYKYLKKQEEKYFGLDRWIKETYTDYKKSFKHRLCFRDFKDPYWKYPKNLRAAHTQINDEINTAYAVEQEELKKKAALDERNVMARLRRVVKKYQGYNAMVDGYSIGVTASMKEWTKQAKTLHQCIVASGYYKGMSRKEYLIVFIQKDSEPIATCQIKKNKQIGQFYADERGGPSNSKPTPEVEKAFYKWLKNVEIGEVI